MNTTLFVSSDDLENVLVCAFCTKEFDTPKVIHCGKSICTKCESKYFKAFKRKKCGFCQDYHEMTANGFPVNDLIQKLLKITPKAVSRGAAHTQTTYKVNRVGMLNHIFEDGLSNLDSVVIEYCDLMRYHVDLKTESAIDAIQKHREQMLSEIDKYQKQHLGKILNLEEFNKFITQSKEHYIEWAKFLHRTDVSNKETSDVLNEVNEILNKFEAIQKKFDIKVFGIQKLAFLENEREVNSNIIGRLTNTIDSSLSNLVAGEPKMEFKYNTEKETQPIKYYHARLLPIDDEKVCIAVSMSSNRNYYLKLKLFSKNGKFIKEIIEELSNDEFGISSFRGNIVAQIRLRNSNSITNSGVLRKYNHNLDLIKNIKVDYSNSSLFTDDESERLYVYSKLSYSNYWTIYDEALNQLDSTATENGTSYPFISNNASQVELKYGRIFIYYKQELRVVDNQTHEILKRIKLGQEYANVDMIVKPTSSETFMTIYQVSKYLRVFDFGLECLREFQIENINEISSVSLTEDNHIVICDNKANKIFVF